MDKRPLLLALGIFFAVLVIAWIVVLPLLCGSMFEMTAPVC